MARGDGDGPALFQQRGGQVRPAGRDDIADGRPRQARDPGQRRQEDPLLPHLQHDPVAGRGLEPRARHGGGDRVHPRRPPAGPLAERQPVEVAGVDHPPAVIEPRRDAAPPTQHPTRASRLSRWRMPLSRGTTAVSGPTAGATDSIASSRSYALQARITTSNVSRNSGARTVGGEGREASPAGLVRTSPFAASRAARPGRTRNVTSRPASSSRPPKYPPIAPAPTIR